MYPKRKYQIAAISMLLCLCTRLLNADGPAATQPASTQPVLAGRDTPAGAMNFFEESLKNRDLANAADCLNAPQARAMLVAADAMSKSRLYVAAAKRFGSQVADQIFTAAGIQVLFPIRTYSADDWTISPASPDRAIGKALPNQKARVPFMQRGADGIWRIGPIRPWGSPRPEMIAAMQAKTSRLATQYDSMIAGVDAGKFATADDLANAIIALSTPTLQQRQERASEQVEVPSKQDAQRQQQEMQAQMQQFMATKFDPTTVRGAVSAFVQARTKKDVAAMANFFFADNDPQGKLASANAQRIVDVADLEEAIRTHVDDQNFGAIVPMFGLSMGGDFPEGYDPQVNGDRAALTSGGDPTGPVWLRLVGGVWKEDLTPQTPMTSSQAARFIDYDNAAVQQVTADILAGKISTLPRVRDAVGEAKLYAVPGARTAFVGISGSENFDVVGDAAQTAVHFGPKGAPPMNRTSPAGAINSFTKALVNLDAAALADSIDIPGDADGTERRALVDEYLAGRRFLVAVEARFGASAANAFAGDYDVRGDKKWMADYTDDEWVITPDYPNLAFRNTTGPGYVERWAPLMRRGPDGIWRITRRFPENPVLMHARTSAAESNVRTYENAITAIKAGKYSTPSDMANDVVGRINLMSAMR
jgi:hypothetical protein